MTTQHNLQRPQVEASSGLMPGKQGGAKVRILRSFAAFSHVHAVSRMLALSLYDASV